MSTPIVIGITELRAHLARITRSVYEDGQEYIVQKSGIPLLRINTYTPLKKPSSPTRLHSSLPARLTKRYVKIGSHKSQQDIDHDIDEEIARETNVKSLRQSPTLLIV